MSGDWFLSFDRTNEGKFRNLSLTFTVDQADLDRADALYSHASNLMTDYADSPVVLDSVRPKSIELQRMSQTLRELFIQRLESLERSRDLYYRIEKVLLI